MHVLRRGEVKQPIKLAEPGGAVVLAGAGGEFQLADRTRGPAGGPGPVDHRPGKPADAALDRESGLAISFRPRLSGHAQRLRAHGLAADPSGVARLAGLLVSGQWRVIQDNCIVCILTSATYRQVSVEQPGRRSVDGENRYLWRMNRTRLDAECMHDAMLPCPGKLDCYDGRSFGAAVLFQG